MTSPDPAPGLPKRAQAVLDAWFGPPGDPDRERQREIWFKSTAEFDAALHRDFLADYEAHAGGASRSWEALPEGALALVLLLDQIPRNIFRNTARAYDTDSAARVAADRALARGFDKAVPTAWSLFFYMPFHHSEDVDDQRRAMALTAQLRASRKHEPDEDGGGNRRYGRSYLDIIAQFGRFPHRNAILGRESTPEEISLLRERNLLPAATGD
jgi:uncharacterized protein (DUF924 family)